MKIAIVGTGYLGLSNGLLLAKQNEVVVALTSPDPSFFIRSAAQTEFCAVSEPLFYYRSHETNIMKTRQRKEIFRQKVLLLTKNFNLVSPWRWYLSINIHFIYDIILKKGK